jgi:signal transduction histidine kinase
MITTTATTLTVATFAKNTPTARVSQPRIVLVAAGLLVAVAMLVGVTVFMVMQRHAEQLLDKSLQSSLQGRVQLTESEIQTGFGRTTVAATRPRFIDLVQRLNGNADDEAARKMLQDVAQSFLPTGLTAIAVFDKDERELARAGSFAQAPALVVPLNLPGRVQLMWDGQLLLHTIMEMRLGGQLVGEVVTQTQLTATTSALKDANRLGSTGEMALCAASGQDLQCFPTTLSSRVFTTPRVAADGRLLPMAHALGGETGFISTQDYRRQIVEAAYAPVGKLGLGMVLKVDSTDLYAPIWWQLRYLVPLLLVVLIISLLSLRWLLAPLVQRLVRSEARIAGLNAELEQRVARRTGQLERSNRELQEFAHAVAHDLRQPFIAIGGLSGLLERRVEDERSRHYISRIKAGVRQADMLTDALLVLANLSRKELQVQAVDLSAMARRVIESLQQKSPGRQASVSIQSGLVVRADPELVGMVMQELLANAWKFTSRQSHTEISFGALPADPGAPDAEPVYVVRDNGEGFDMAHSNKLFRSFQRLHTEHDFPGAGVGLANIQRIVARHNGRAWAEAAPGEGASFYFTLGNARA